MFIRELLVILSVMAPCLGWAHEQKPILTGNDETSVTVVDKRSEEQKNGKVLSTTIWKCTYAIRRIGDIETTPSRLEHLKQVLTKNVPEMRGRTVTVKNYTMHLNASAFARNGFSRSYSGAVAAAVNAPVVGCAPEDLQGGYTPGEIPLKNSPIISVIDLIVGGQEFHLRSISDTDVRFFRKREDAPRNFGNASAKAMDELVHQLREFLSAPAG